MLKHLLLSKKIGILLIVLAGLLVGAGKVNGATRIASVSGNWSATATWGGSAMPTSADAVTINAGITVTVDVASAQCATLTFAAVSANSTLTVSGTNALSVTGLVSMPRPSSGFRCTIAVGAGSLTAGSLTMAASTTTRNDIISISSGTVTINGLLTTGTTGCQFNFTGSGLLKLGGTFSGGPAALTPSTGTVEYTGATPVVQAFSGSYYNLKFSGSGLTSGGASGNITITGDLTRTGSGTLNFTSRPVIITGTNNQSIAGFATTGNVSMTKTAGTATLTGNVNGLGLTLSGLGGTLNLGTGLTHTFTGTWTRTNGTLNGGSSLLRLGAGYSNTVATFTAGTGTVEYYASAVQTCAPVVYNNLILSGTLAKTLTSITTVNGDLTLSGAATSSVAAGFTIGGNLLINNGTSFTVPAYSISVGGTTTIGGGTSGTLILSSATGAKTFTGNVTINNGATWSESVTLIPVNFGGSLQNNGTLTANTGLHNFSGTSKTISGISPISISNTTISGTYANSAVFTVGTLLTVNTTLTNNATINATTALSGTGTLIQGTNANLNINGTSTISTLSASASGNTVSYTGAAQTLNPTSAYHHLTLSGSGIKTLNAATTTINGNFTLSGTAITTGVVGLTIGGDVVLGSGTSFTAGAFTHNLSGNWTNNGSTFTNTGSTINFNNTSVDQNINGTAVTQTFNNLTVAKSSKNLIIGGSTTKATIGGTLTMTSGNINAGANTFELGTGTGTPGTLIYTSGNIIGTYKKWFNTTATSKQIPLGTAAGSGTSTSNRYAFLTFSNLTAGSLTMSFISSNPGLIGLPLDENSQAIENQFTEGYWSFVAADGLASNSYILALSGVGFLSYTMDAETRLIKRPNGGSWVLDGAHVAGSPPTASRSGLNGFGEFVFATAKPFPTANFTTSSQTSAAESGTMTITAQLSATSMFNVTVPFTIDASSTATPGGVDYSITASPISIPAGSTTGTANITIATDLIDEPNETVVVNMGTPTKAVQGITIVHTATITDDDSPPTVSFTTAGQSSVNESGTMTITAQLSVASGFNVTVPFTVNAASTATGGSVDYHISASPVIIPAGSTSANITITIDDDVLIEGNETVIVNMGTPTNATLGAITTQTATITDDEAPPVANFTTSSQASIAESGTMTITVQLSAVSTLNVSVPFTVNGSSTATGGTDYSIIGSPVLINAGSTTGTITISIIPDFLDEPNETVIVNMGTPVNATQGATITHTATITDDDLSGFTITPTTGLVTDESGAQASFTVKLNSQPTADVTIAISSDDLTEGTVSTASLTFTSANWNTTQTVTLTGVDDLLDDGDIVYQIVTGAAVSGDGNYSGMNPTDVTATNSDNDTAGFTISPTSITTTEAGGTATITVKLNTLPFSDVNLGLSSSNTNEGTVSPASLTFTPANWNINQTVTVSGVDDSVDDGDIAYAIVTAPATSAGSYNNLNPIDVSATNIDNDTKGITVSAISSPTTEAGGTATFTIVLNSQPSASVNVGLSSGNTAEGTVSPANVAFTTANWNAPQTVTITGVDDFVDDGDIVYTIVTAAAAGGDYAGINANDVSVTNIDNDTKGITVSAISGSTTEAGGTATFTVVLTSQPTASVNIGLTSSNTAEGTVSPALVTFTTANWNTPQTVTVTGVDDFVDDGDITYTIVTAAATGGDYATLNAADVTVINIDNDTAGFTVNPLSLVTTEAAGAGHTATYTIKLNSQPTANVSIGISSNDLTEGTVAPASLSFTSGNWSTTQTITVTGVDDPMVDGNITYSVINAAATSADLVYNGLNTADVSVTNNDNDVAGITVTPTSGLITTEAGGATSFTVVLTSQPSANVVIGISSSDLTEGTVSSSSLTFTPANWNISQSVDVTGVNDFMVDGNIAYTIITAAAVSTDPGYSGMNPSYVSASNTDDDVAGFTVGPITGNTTEAGGTASFTVVLTSQPSADVTVGISSGDLTEGTVSPASLTFTNANWSSPQTVTVTGVDDFIVDGNINYSVIISAAVSSDPMYNGLNPSDVNVTNIDNDTRSIFVSTVSGPTTEAGGTATFTVVLTSIPTANVSIGVSSDDLTEGTISTSSLTFTPANWNIPQTVTITGVNDFVADGDISYNIVLAAATGGDYAGINPNDVPIVNMDNDVGGITITPSGGTTSESGTSVVFSVVLTSQPTASVSFSIVSSDTGEGTLAPASLTFTTANWNSIQTFTVTGVPDFVIDGDTPYTVTASSSSTDPDYNAIDNNLAMINLDIDVAGFTIIPSSGLITTEAGGTATFTVKLNTQPTANVTIGLSSNDLTEGTVSPASLTFTNANWNSAQTVTITGVNDVLADGDIAYSVVTAAATSTDPNYNNLNSTDISVTNTDLTPTISGFSPSPVCYGSGASVVISGTKFMGATFVRFNGVNSSYTVNSSIQITATLPATATTGTLSVITPTGTAVSGFSLTVNPVSVGGSVAGGTTICSGSPSALLTLSGQTGTVTKWQSSPDGSTWTDITNTGTTYTSGALTQTTLFRAVVQSGVCSSANSSATTVTVLSTPTATISGTTTVCQSAANPSVTFTNPQALPVTITYNINGGSNTTVNVGANATATVAAPTTTAGSFVYNLVSVVYQATPTCSNSISGTATITITPIVGTPSAPSGSSTRCQGTGTDAYTTSASDATSYTWIVTAPNTISGTGSTGTVTWAAGFSGTATVSVTATGCGTSGSVSTTVTVTPTVGTPTTPTPSASTICQGSANTTYTTSATNATSYTWSVTGTGNTISGTGTTGTVTWAAGFSGTATVSVTATGCGTSGSVSTTVTVTPTVGTPTTPTPSASTICQGSANTTYTTSATDATSYTWSVTAPNTISGTGTTGTVTWAAGFSGTATVSVTATGCGTSGSVSTTVVVLPTPTATISGTTTVCQIASAPTVTFTNPQTLPVTITYNINGSNQTTVNVAASSTATVAAPTASAGTFDYNLVSVVYQSAPTCSNAITGKATVTVGDTESPVISQCLADGTALCVNNVPAGITTIDGFRAAGGTVSDNCTATNNLIVTFADVIDPNLGCKLKRTYTVTDPSGNSATCTQTFTINDTEVPVINSVVNLVVTPNDNSCGANLTIDQPALEYITENCSLINEGAYYQYTIGGTPYSGHGSFTALFPEGTTAINWTVSDLCGHVSASKTQTVQVGFNLTPISYDNGSSANGAGSGVQPIKTSTHEYFVDNKTPEIDYSYVWELFEANGATPVSSSLYTKTSITAAHIKISFTTVPIGNYILSIIKTKNGITCNKPQTLSVTVLENTFDTELKLFGDHCQAGETGTPSTILWEVKFAGSGVAPYSLNYAVNLKDENDNPITVCSGSVSSITLTAITPDLVHSSGCSSTGTMPYMQVVKTDNNAYTVLLKYTMSSVTAENFKVSIQIQGSDQFTVSETIPGNNAETLNAHGVPNTSAITTD